MPKKLLPLAIAYDFDGTLAPGNMQEHDFIPQVRVSSRNFWNEVKATAKAQNADEILVYMNLMLAKARHAGVSVRRQDFRRFGRSLTLFPGVEGWFDRINTFARVCGVRVDHYVISSGIREMVMATKIAKHFEAIFASSFMFDNNDAAYWPALALNYTTKTQYLFRINKGSLDVFDHTTINEYVPKDKRPIPFERMIFIGDGDTDIPCFRLVNDQRGHAIAVYRPHSPKARKRSQSLIKDGRVRLTAPADYRDGGQLDQMVKAIIDKVATDHHLHLLGKIA